MNIYILGVQRLQKHLLNAYTEYSKMNSITIGRFENVNVDDIYVEQTLEDNGSTPAKKHDTNDMECRSVTHKASNFLQLFQQFEERHFILASSPGGGKSTFCLKFVSSWCSVVKKSLMPDSSLTQSERELLNQIRLLFFISMQTAEDEVIEMIKNQIFSENKDLIKDVESCFKEIPNDCLVIIDGVDECHKSFSSELPKRDKLNFCRITWTTRYSKLHLLSTLQNTHIFEISPLNEKSVRELASNLLKIILDDPSVVEVKLRQFMNGLIKRKMELLAGNPLILIYFVLQWYEEHGLEESMTLNYVGVLDRLLKANEVKSAETSQIGKSVLGMPRVLQSKGSIKQNAQILRRICPFAFDCCLQSLYVFEDGPFGEIIGTEHIQKCLKSGLLIKLPVFCQRSNSKRRIKFFHKTLQELLAAVWICWKDPKKHNNRLEMFLENYKTIDQILEIELILTFICGLDSKKAMSIAKHIAMTALREEEFERYRRSLQGRYIFRSSGEMSTTYRKIKRVQQMMLDCKEEMNLNRYCKRTSPDYIATSFGSIFYLRNGENIFPLHDIIIADKLDESVFHMLVENTKTLRSIYIDLPKAIRNARIEDALCETTQMERLSLDQTSSSVINRLSQMQLQKLLSLSLCLDKIDKFPESINHLVNVRALFLNISGGHRMLEQLEQILKSLKHLEELELERIVCEEHKKEKHNCEFSIDLSNSDNLKKLILEDVCSSRMTLPFPDRLEEIRLSGATLNAFSCIRQLSESESSLSSIVLGDLNPFIWPGREYKYITLELTKLYHLEYVYLVGINFEKYDLTPTFYKQRKLKYLCLEYIQLSRSSWILLLLSLVEGWDRGCESKAEVHIFTEGFHKDIISIFAPRNAKKIFLDLKQEKYRGKVLGLKALV